MASKLHYYSEEQNAWLVQHRETMLLTDLAAAFSKKFGVPRNSKQIQWKCKQLGVTKPHAYQKGLVPWNKGKKTGIQNPNVFKPGQKPFNTKPVGALRRNQHGTIQYKYAEGTGNWRALHLYIWEKHNRKLNPDERVLFLDGDKNNLDISNLAMVNKAELAAVVIKHKFGPHNPPEINAAIVAMVKLEQAANRAQATKRICNAT